MSDACDLLVTGAKGQLGRAVLELAAARGLQTVGVDAQEVPLDDRASVQRGVAAARREVGRLGPRLKTASYDFQTNDGDWLMDG